MAPGRFMLNTPLHTVSTVHRAMAGRATSTPLDASIRALVLGLRLRAEQHPVEHQSQERSKSEHGDERRNDDRQMLTGVELEVKEGADERHRTLGEVEDPRRRVGEHQSRRHHRIDGARNRARYYYVQKTVTDAPLKLMHRKYHDAGRSTTLQRAMRRRPDGSARHGPLERGPASAALPRIECTALVHR